MADDGTQTVGKSRRRLSLTTWIAIGLFVGVGCGLFFGEYCSHLKWIGDAYVGLLQMSVLPYVALSLIANVGSLSLAQGRRLLVIGVVIMGALWIIGLVMMLAMAQAFPHWQTGSFFSASFVEEPDPPNWIELFIPSNPFRSLTQNAVPAVVVFSIGIGLALIGLPNKAILLDPLTVLVDALAALNKLVVRLSPVGMFGIAAYTSGVIDPNQFQLIQGYLLTYGAAALLLSVVVLPCLISSLTPFSIREIVRVSRDPLITAFVIGNSFVVLPMIIEAVKELYQRQRFAPESEANPPEYLVPLAYPFPDIGRIVGIVFIPFAAWFYGSAISAELYPAIIGVGTLGAFGKPVITIPVLLNIAELPGDIFNLFLASGVIAARFGDFMKCMHLLTFTVLTSCAIAGVLRPKWNRLFINLVLAVVLTVLTVIAIRTYLNVSFKDSFSKEQLLATRQLVFYDDQQRPLARLVPRRQTILTDSEIGPNPVPIQDGQSRVARIKESGVLRIGFDPQKLPFCYFKDQGNNNEDDGQELNGFDIDLVHFLAYDLIDDPELVETGIRIEFVPYDPDDLVQQLRDDYFDVAISAIEGTVDQAADLPSIQPYMEVTLALVVQDRDKRHFQTRDQVLNKPDLKLAVIKDSYFAEQAPRVLPNAAEKLLMLDSAEDFFESEYSNVDGLVISAEVGSAWTLRYPSFTVTNPIKGKVRVPLYYLTPDDLEFEGFLQNWLTLKRNDGTIDELYDYWILGKAEKSKPQRWSVIRDVLGWVD